MPTVLETDRLLLREFQVTDAAFVLRLLNEPSWLRFIGDRGVRSLEDARRFIETRLRSSYAQDGFGLWCVVPKDSGEPAGMCGLLRRDALPDVDVGFAFLPEAWGKGYAREAASAVLAHARDVLGKRRVLAITFPDNRASIRVLERIGMRREGEIRLAGESRDTVLFSRDL